MKKSFSKQDLLEVIYDDSSTLKKVESEIQDTTRWSIIEKMIFQEISTGLFYQIEYSYGATEYQDERPFEHDGDLIECVQVEPVEVKSIVYKPIKDS